MFNFRKIPSLATIIPTWVSIFLILACQNTPENWDLSSYLQAVEKIDALQNNEKDRKNETLPASEIEKNNAPTDNTDQKANPWQSLWAICLMQDAQWKEKSKEWAKEYRWHLYNKQEKFIGNWYFLAGRLLGLHNKPEQARYLFQKGIQLDSQNPWPYYGMGMYFLKNRSPFYAQIYLNHALRIEPQLVPAMVGLAKLLEDQDYSQAIQLLSNAIRITPDDADLHHDLGSLLQHNKQFAEALLHLQTAATLSPQNPRILRDLANLYLQQQRHAEAADTIRQLIPLVESKESRARLQQMLTRLESFVE